MKKSKKIISLLLALVMLVALCGTAAFAAEDAPDAAPADTAALKVYTKAPGAAAVLSKEYTAEALAALTEKGTAGYLYYKGTAWNAVAATEYVTLDALFSDAGVTFAAGDRLSFVCSDGAYTKSVPGYGDIEASKYYIDGDAITEVPAAIATTWAQGSLDGSSLSALAGEAKNTGSLRLVYGITSEQYAAKSAAGMRYPSGVVSVTVLKGFSDVTKSSDWFYASVNGAVDAGLIAGLGDGSFGVNGKLTWAQTVAFVVRTHQYLAKETPYTSADQKGANWYDVYVNYAKDKGIITETAKDPNAAISRGDAAVLFAKAFGSEDGTGKAFSDVAADSATAGAIYALYNAGIINGMGDGTFGVSKTLNRAQAATFIYRIINESARLTVAE